MNALPFILGGGAILLVVAAASKAKASTPSSASASTAKPSTATATPPVIVGPGGTAPAYLESVPYVIALRVISLGDPALQQAQGIWLTDNGYPKTGEAVQKYSRGEITAIELRQIAQAEFKANPIVTTTATSTTKPKGTQDLDRYGSYLLAEGDNDTLYSYAMSSTSIPLVREAAARFAVAGDTRSIQLTEHLVELTM